MDSLPLARAGRRLFFFGTSAICYKIPAVDMNAPPP